MNLEKKGTGRNCRKEKLAATNLFFLLLPLQQIPSLLQSCLTVRGPEEDGPRLRGQVQPLDPSHEGRQVAVEAVEVGYVSHARPTGGPAALG